jgi:hypothetical protein
MSDARKVRRAADEISGLMSDLHWLRRDVQHETDQGRGSSWHAELENQLADMIEEADRCHARVELLAWDLELGGEDEDTAA